jgi:hypothetical protein
MRRWAVGVLLAAALVPGVASGALTGSPAAGPRPLPLAATRPFPRPSRIALLILENRSYRQVIGNPSAPYLNSLARSGALAIHYYAITHPSLPNYVAMTTGGHAEVSSDCAHCASDGQSLVDQLDAAGVSWRAYFESLPSRLATPYSRAAPYNRHYNPFVYTETLKPTDLAAAHITASRRFTTTSSRRRCRTSPGSLPTSSTTGTARLSRASIATPRTWCRRSSARSARAACC